MTKPANTQGSAIRTMGLTAPVRFVEFVREQAPRALRFSLVQQSSISTPQAVDAWGQWKMPEALADLIWERALEDSASIPTLGATAYTVIVTAKEGGDGARFGLRLPPPKNVAVATNPEPANTEGIIAQALRHLNTRESASHALFVEGLEGVFASIRVQLDETAKTRSADNKHFETVIEGYRSLCDTQKEGYALTLKSLSEHLRATQSALEAQTMKTLEMLPTMEELHSQKHERDLAAIKARRTEDRKDRLLDKAEKFVFPVLAKKLGAPAGFFSPPAAAPAPSSAPVPAAAPESPAPPAAIAADGMRMQATFMGPSVLRAVEKFLGALQEDELKGMRAALGAETGALLEEIVVCLGKQVMEEAEARQTTSAANGVARAGAPS